MPRGKKRVIDVERQLDETSDLSIDELRTMATDVATRLAALRRRWEATGDLYALIGALILHQPQLPEWLSKGLIQKLNEQFTNPDAMRFLAVRYAHDVLEMTMDEAYDWASRNVTPSIAKGGRDSMMKSYQKIRRQVAPINSIRPRPPQPRRRR